MGAILPLLGRFWYVPVMLILILCTYALYERGNAAKAELETFRVQVKAVGEVQNVKTKETIANQERVSRETVNSYQKRLDLINAEYKRLRDKAGSGSRELPRIPDTTQPVDDTARNQRLLEVLRAADLQAAQLIELQEWVRQQAK